MYQRQIMKGELADAMEVGLLVSQLFCSRSSSLLPLVKN